MQHDLFTPLIAFRLCVFDETSWGNRWLLIDVEALLDSFNLVGCLFNDLAVGCFFVCSPPPPQIHEQRLVLKI